MKFFITIIAAVALFSTAHADKPTDLHQGVIEKIYGKRVKSSSNYFLKADELSKRREFDGLSFLAISIKSKIDLGLITKGQSELTTPFSDESRLFPLSFERPQLIEGKLITTNGKLLGEIYFFADSNNDVFAAGFANIYTAIHNPAKDLSIAKIGKLLADGSIALDKENKLLSFTTSWMQCQNSDPEGCVSQFIYKGTMYLPVLEN